MHYEHTNRRKLLYLTLTTIVFVSCAPEIKRPVRICPGKKSIDEALATLQAHCENVKPFKATGQCLLEYHTDTNKRKRENFFIRFWLNPPAEIYLQGDVALNPRGIILGSNREEFWLTIKPKEISGYWWGRWDETKYVDDLLFSPKVILEALGVAALDSQKQDKNTWSLSNEGAFDVLTSYDSKGYMTKKVYIFCCDYLINKIEYFDSRGQASVVVKLGKYKELIADFFLPTKIMIIRYSSTGKEDSVKITIKSVKQMSFSQKLRNRIFIRQEPKGFEHIFRVIEGQIIEQ